MASTVRCPSLTKHELSCNRRKGIHETSVLGSFKDSDTQKPNLLPLYISISIYRPTLPLSPVGGRASSPPTSHDPRSPLLTTMDDKGEWGEGAPRPVPWPPHSKQVAGSALLCSHLWWGGSPVPPPPGPALLYCPGKRLGPLQLERGRTSSPTLLTATGGEG